MKPLLPFIFTTDSTLQGRWAYMLSTTIQFRLTRKIRNALEIYSGKHHIASIAGDVLTIHAGYAWDGCTSWPDSPTNLLASLAHDLGYQMGTHPRNPFTRTEIDRWFLDLLRHKNDPSPRMLWLGVRLAGWKFWNKEKDLTIKSK